MENKTFDRNSRDPLFDEVVAYSQGHKQLSPSVICAKFSIGFNRANRIIQQIEECQLFLFL